MNAFDLVTHAIERHHADERWADAVDADTLREWHEQDHAKVGVAYLQHFHAGSLL